MFVMLRMNHGGVETLDDDEDGEQVFEMRKKFTRTDF